VTEAVRQLRFSPSGYELLQAAIVAAGLPRMPPYEEYAADLDRAALKLEDEGILVQPTMISVERMLTKISEQGCLPDAKNIKRYLESTYGANRLRRRMREKRRWRQVYCVDCDEPRSGTLTCWQPINGGPPMDTRWERYEATPEPPRWLAEAKAAVARAERAAAPRDDDDELLEWQRLRRRRPGE